MSDKMERVAAVPRRLPFPSRRELLRLLLWVPVALFATDVSFEVVSVEGASMTPTLNPDWAQIRQRDWILLDKWHRTWGKPWTRGDIVTLWSPTSNQRRLTVKRIIGVEGDVIQAAAPYPQRYVKLEKGQVWVEGDNEKESKDSRMYGPLPITLLHSRVSRILFPFSRQVVLEPAPPPEPASNNSASNSRLRHSRRVTGGAAPQLDLIHQPVMARLAGSAGAGFGVEGGLGEGDRPGWEEERVRRRLAKAEREARRRQDELGS